jgi:hypothetical protein
VAKSAPPRRMTEREVAVLDHLLFADFDESDDLHRQAKTAIAMDGCGCPSVDFVHPESAAGVTVVVNASVRNINDSMFLFMVGSYLGGIEYVWIDEPIASELPHPSQIELLP